MGASLRTTGLATLVLMLAPAATPGRAQEPIVLVSSVTPAKSRLACAASSAKCFLTAASAQGMTSTDARRQHLQRRRWAGIQKIFEAPFADPLAAGVQFYAVLGNHDIRRGTELQIHYPAWNMTGRRFYGFSKGDGLIEFFALDSTALSDEARALVLVEKARLDTERAALQRKKTTLTASERRRLEKLNAELGEDVVFINEQAAVKNAQLVWLRDALANSRARWKIVFLHHSIYSAATKSGGHGGERSVLRLRHLLEPIFVAGGVDLVLAGHDHHYDRSTLQPANAPASHQVQYVTDRRQRTFETEHHRLLEHVSGEGRRVDSLLSDRRGDERCPPD